MQDPTIKYISKNNFKRLLLLAIGMAILNDFSKEKRSSTLKG